MSKKFNSDNVRLDDSSFLPYSCVFFAECLKEDIAVILKKYHLIDNFKVYTCTISTDGVEDYQKVSLFNVKTKAIATFKYSLKLDKLSISYNGIKSHVAEFSLGHFGCANDYPALLFMDSSLDVVFSLDFYEFN